MWKGNTEVNLRKSALSATLPQKHRKKSLGNLVSSPSSSSRSVSCPKALHELPECKEWQWIFAITTSYLLSMLLFSNEVTSRSETHGHLRKALGTYRRMSNKLNVKGLMSNGNNAQNLFSCQTSNRLK